MTDEPPLSFTSSPLSGLIRRAPVCCAPDTPIRSVLQSMRDQDIGSMVVCSAEGAPIGIFTVQDALARVALGGIALDAPVTAVITGGLASLGPQASAYDAVLLMAARGIRHLAVVANGRLVGIVSERDLFGRLGASPREVGNSVRNATTSVQLSRSGAQIRELAHEMLEQGVGAAQVTQMLSTLNDLLTRRIIDLEFASAALGDIRFCWISMGSEGRHEQTFNSDQDNGIIFALPQGVIADEVRTKLLPAAKRVNRQLAACGLALCRGNIMASNRECCLSLGEWRNRFAEWVDHGDPQALLNATIFFDFRALHGAAELADELREWLNQYAPGNSRFLLQMTQNALGNQPPLGLLRDFVFPDKLAHPHTLDLKVNGVTPFVDAARILALAAGVTDTNTPQRLRLAAKRLKVKPAVVDAWVEAFYFIQFLRLRHQDSQARARKPLDNLVDPDDLNELDRRILIESMRQARKLQQRLARERSVSVSGFGA
jgi:CBS domain-containing protein